MKTIIDYHANDWRYTIEDNGTPTERAALTGDAALRRVLALGHPVEVDAGAPQLPGGDGVTGWAAVIQAHNAGLARADG